MKRAPLFLPLLLLLPLTAVQAQDTVAVRFETRQATVWGESVYLLGDAPALGGGDLTRARRMVPEAGGQWSLNVALPPGTDYSYRYWVRNNDPRSLSDSRNGRQVSGDLQGRAPGTATTRRVSVRYLSGWSGPVLRYLRAPGDVREAAFTRLGAGRGAGESLWEISAETTLAELEFVIRGDGGAVDRAPSGGAYQTGLGTFLLASGRVHAGRPNIGLLPSGGGRVLRVDRWYSQHTQNARSIFIYLPPSYDASNARYPVLYMHDGQNLFGPDAMFGGWRVAETVDRLIAAGQLPEIIVVGAANTAARMSEYIPEADGGEASRYGRFLTDELKPWVDRSWRTRPEREHTGVCGSSLGGLVSLYLGVERSDVYGRVASLSGSFWLRDYVEALERSGRRPAIRLWLDSGDQGASADSLENTLYVRDLLLRRGFTLGGDLEHFVDYGASHNEAYWRGRLERVLRYLFPAR